MPIETPGCELLTPAEMRHADELTIEAGRTGRDLMERAGTAVADVISERYPDGRSIALLAGPGNNGGDAFVAARVLQSRGKAIRLSLSSDRAALTGDAADAAAQFRGSVDPLADFDPSAADVVVDGLFGAGLSKPIEGEAAAVIERANASGRPIIAIDLPSGVSGLTGETHGVAIQAATTVTFFRRKPGHLLQPGRSRCGDVVVAEIGIDRSVIATIGAKAYANEPAFWKSSLLQPSDAGHKYDRGHAVVFSGTATKTGAARMSATAALRAGAGLVTLASPASALLVNAVQLTAVMLQRCDDIAELSRLLEDKRLNAFVIGPGFGIGEKAGTFARAVIAADRHIVVDADAISSFKDDPNVLFDAVRTGKGATVLTPHAGEFAGLFPDLAEAKVSKLDKAEEAAARSGAIVVLKGSDTVIAAPDGRTAINGTGTPYLATAGTGDVLTGMICGLLAQDVSPFEAAAAAVWMHGLAALGFGPGLIAEDLPQAIPAVLRKLWTSD